MKKIYHLEGVRAVGALIVFVCHFQIIVVPNFYHDLYLLLHQHMGEKISNFIVVSGNLVINGNMFLHIFWALSAYVIFKKFFEYGAGENIIVSNVLKRYIRLMVPCAVSIFFSYAIYKLGFIYVRGIPVETIQQNLYLIPPSFLHALKTSVWSTMFNYDYYDSYNGPLWTIEREFYGSIFCFALFGVLGKSFKRGLIYIGIFSIVLGLKMYWLNSFLFGYFLADYDYAPNNSEPVKKTIEKINNYIATHQLAVSLAGLVLLLACKMILYKLPDRLDLINCFLCFLIIFISLRINVVTRIMGAKVFTSIGKISFSLYVLHWPIICSFTSWYYLKHSDHSVGFLCWLFILTTAITMVLSWLFYKLVDLKSITLAKHIARRFNDYIKLKPRTENL